MTVARWRLALWGGMVLVAAWLAWNARGALLPFAVGAMLAYTLTPLVDRLARLVPLPGNRWALYRRGIAVLLIYVCFGAVLFALGAMLVPVIADQIAQFVETLPTLVDDANAQFDEWLREYQSRVPVEAQDRIDGYVQDAADAASTALADAARRSIGLLTGTISVLFGFAVVPFWLFYALRDRHAVSRNFMNAVPPEVREDASNVLSVADRVLGRYVRGQIVLGLIVGTAVGVILTLMDIPLSIALGVFAGVTELIPIIGPWLGAVPGLLIVAASEPDMLPWVALVYFLVQQVENNFLVPRVQGQAVEIHPAMVILLLVVGGAAFGFVGLLVTVPAVAILRELFWYADRRLTGATPEQAMRRSDTSVEPGRPPDPIPPAHVRGEPHPIEASPLANAEPPSDDDGLPPPLPPAPPPVAEERREPVA